MDVKAVVNAIPGVEYLGCAQQHQRYHVLVDGHQATLEVMPGDGPEDLAGLVAYVRKCFAGNRKDEIQKAVLTRIEKLGATIDGISSEGPATAYVIGKGGRQVVTTFRNTQSIQSVLWNLEATLEQAGFVTYYRMSEGQLRELFETGVAVGEAGCCKDLEGEFKKALVEVHK